MARSLNQASLIGNVGKDPELRYTGGGTAVCNVSLATNESYKDKDGELVEKTAWHRVTAWGRLAEIIGEHVEKGSRLFIQGRLTYGQYEDEDGKTIYTFEVTAREMIMLDGPSKKSGGSGSASSSGGGRSSGYQNTGDDPFGPDDDPPF